MTTGLRLLMANALVALVLPPVQAAPATAPARAAIGHWGVDTAGLSGTVRPGDDFDRHANMERRNALGTTPLGSILSIISGLTDRNDLGRVMAWPWMDGFIGGGVLADPHSPGEFRVNGIVRNVDAWYRAFNVQPGDKLYLPSDKRVKIW